jgi:hypothetical protein
MGWLGPAWLGACDPSSTSPSNFLGGGEADATAVRNQDGGTGAPLVNAPDDPVFTVSSDSSTDSATCRSNAECDGGVCSAGACCPTVESACNGTCCQSGTVCVFDRCVAPGKTCQSNNDCSSEDYCETALGTAPSGGTSTTSDAGLCTAPVPLSGKCVAMPPKCSDGQTSPACVAACEYRPPVGALKPTVKWKWGYPDTPNALGATELPDAVDVWSTPVVGRMYDGNCDGKLNELDSPSIVFVAADSRNTSGIGVNCNNAGTNTTISTSKIVSACHRAVLRAVDGRTGKTLWSKSTFTGLPLGYGFAGVAPALADIDKDGRLDVIAMMGDGRIAVLGGDGSERSLSDKAVNDDDLLGNGSFGWGGGLSVADMDADGYPEIAYGSTVFRTRNGAGAFAIERLPLRTGGLGGNAIYTALSFFADLDPSPGVGGATGSTGPSHLELLAGKTAYRSDGTVLWTAKLASGAALDDGFSAVADFDKDGKPEAVLVVGGKVAVLDGLSGTTLVGPLTLDGTGHGGPPTVADFDGDGVPEIGVAQKDFYFVLKPQLSAKTLDILWKHPNHDLSSSVTGSTVFDFEGDGKAEVIYADECYLWVWGYDAQAKKPVVRFATPTSSFTGTESSLVADVDGDGHAEIVLISNRANPTSAGWKCDSAPWNDPTTADQWAPGTPKWTPPAGMPAGDGKSAYRGVTIFGDSANAWVGTRTLWTQHAYHVSHVCDDRDSACASGSTYGSIPTQSKRNWEQPWLNNFRQNVQDKGIFDAPDAVVALSVNCESPLAAKIRVKNQGLKALPAGVQVGVFIAAAAASSPIATASTTQALLPGQTQELFVTLNQGTRADRFKARVLVDNANPTFRQCREDNDESPAVEPVCAVIK